MTNTRTKVVLVLFGGESSEHDVSIMSARNVLAALNRDKYTPLLCYIDTAGAWWHVDTVAKHNAPATLLAPLLGTSSVRIGDTTMPIDILFPVLHGPNGEDGTVQGLATLLHTPLVGCGLDGSYMCMDKVLTKQLLRTAGIPVVPSVTYHHYETRPRFEDVREVIGGTLFIKPARQGSSVGVSKANTPETFTAALDEALRYDNTVLIESAVSGVRELETAVLGPTHEPEVSVVGEITPDREFYSYESKYDTNSTSTVTIPAAIDAATSSHIQEYAKQAFTLLHCKGLARIDFFIDDQGAIYLNEVNTMPGFTNISMYPKLWEASGLSYEMLLERLLSEAI